MPELEEAMLCSPDAKSQRRLNAMHLLLLGVSYQHVLRNSLVSERTLRTWIACFNQGGIDGLTYKNSPGRPRNMAPEEVQNTILPLVDKPEDAGQNHWTLTKLCGYLREEKGLEELKYRTLVRYLHEHDYARLIPRRFPLASKPDDWQKEREAFAPKLLELLEDPQAEVFFGDESGFEGDPRPRLKWVKRGSKPTQGYYGGHIRQSVIGAVCPASGQLVSLIVTGCDSKVFQVFLDTMAKEVPDKKGKKIILVLDNASWHKAKCLNWHHIEPLFLPPYSPDMNPIERLWQHMKSNYLAGFITNCRETLSDKLCEVIRHLLTQPHTLQSVCNTLSS